MSQRQYAPAAERNKDPILEVLERVLPEDASVLEIASGTGQHAFHVTAYLPTVTWQPTDPSEDARESISAWIAAASPQQKARLKEPFSLDTTTDSWGVDDVNAIVCINMIHIAPWEACLGLFRGAAKLFSKGGILYLYGPYAIGGSHTAPSNKSFDQSLRSRNPLWGVRDLDDVRKVAEENGFEFLEKVAMPANNFSVIFRKK